LRGGAGIKPFTLGQDSPKKKKKKSTKQEKKWAETVDGKVQPASGATWHSKGDVKEKLAETKELFTKFLWDNKYTDSKSFRIKGDDWEKLKEYAFKAGGYIPGMQVEINSKELKKPVELIVIEKNDFLMLKEMVDLIIERAEDNE